MKFRCERDVLDRAFSIARRAVSGRGGNLQVLSGLHLQLVGDKLTVTGPEGTEKVEVNEAFEIRMTNTTSFE
mgnify:CR=1 FL=1